MEDTSAGDAWIRWPHRFEPPPGFDHTIRWVIDQDGSKCEMLWPCIADLFDYRLRVYHNIELGAFRNLGTGCSRLGARGFEVWGLGANGSIYN